MSADPVMLEEFGREFAKIDLDDPPRPELFGYTRVVRHLHQVEQALARVERAVSKNPAVPVPKGPVTAYELWEQKAEDSELGSLFGDIFKVDPKALGMIVE
jgi:hypothetical protein